MHAARPQLLGLPLRRSARVVGVTAKPVAEEEAPDERRENDHRDDRATCNTSARTWCERIGGGWCRGDRTVLRGASGLWSHRLLRHWDTCVVDGWVEGLLSV